MMVGIAAWPRWLLTTQYISVYPIAMSVRSTNVYEERSLGLFNGSGGMDDDLEPEDKGPQAVAKYLGWQCVSSLQA